jgi:hypothetical protein
MFLGLMAYLKPKGRWDKSMLLKPWPGEDIERAHGETRVTWQNLDWLKSNSRSVKNAHPPETMSETGAVSCAGMGYRPVQPLWRGRCPGRAFKGMSGLPKSRSTRTAKTYHGIA